MSELPESWIATTLDAIAEHPQYGFTTSSTPKGTVRLLRITDISSGSVVWETVPFCELLPDNLEKYLLKQGDIVVARSGATVGSSFLITSNPDVASVFASYLIRFRTTGATLPKYLAYYLKSKIYWEFISQSSSGIAQPNVNGTKLRELPIPLAPINEQKRIVAKLDKLLPKVEACKQRLEKIPRILKRFRQSVLAAAVSGKLTDEWRQRNRRKSKASDFGLPEGLNLTNAVYNEDGWLQLSIKDLFKAFGGGTPSKSEKSYWNGNISWVSSGDVKEDEIYEGSETITEEGLNNSSAKICPVGSIIIVVRSGILKHTLPVAIVRKELAINQDIKCFTSGDISLDHWLSIFLKAWSREILALNREGTTVQSVKMETLNEMTIGIPTIAERGEIEDRVSKLLENECKLTSRFVNSERFIGRLTQAILSKAFSGTLVTQDPTDEPASTLLERLKTSSATSTNGSKPKRTRKTKDQDASASA